jgi:hypothetical protein
MGAPVDLDPEAQRAIVEWSIGTPEGRRYTTRLGDGLGLAFVAWYYLKLATADCHMRWYAELDRHDRALVLAPRAHGKTSSIARVLVLHRILTNRNVRILLLSRTTQGANDSLSVIKADLETNADLLGDWQVDAEGGAIRSKGAWGQTQFTVRRAKNLRDPTLRARGWGSALTGGRYDLIILDDIEDDASVLNAAQRRKTVARLQMTVAPLLDTGGRLVVIGTKKHAADLYAHLAEDPTYALIHDRAILEWPDLARVVYEVEHDASGKEIIKAAHVPEDTPGRSLWPEKWPVSALLMIRRSIGERAFQQEYQNEAVDDASTPFRLGWLKAATARGADLGFVREGCYDHDPLRPVPRCEGLIVYQAVDLSLVDDPEAAEEQDSDWTVVETWGLDWTTQTRTLLRLARKQGLSQGEILGFVRTEAARFPQRIAVVVENNSFGKLYEMGLKRSTSLPIYGHTTDKKKHDVYEGVPAMATLYETDKVILPSASGARVPEGEDEARGLVEVFTKEHHGLGRERHDDTVMCAWIAETWIRGYIARREIIEREKQKGKGGGARVRTL